MNDRSDIVASHAKLFAMQGLHELYFDGLQLKKTCHNADTPMGLLPHFQSSSASKLLARRCLAAHQAAVLVEEPISYENFNGLRSRGVSQEEAWACKPAMIPLRRASRKPRLPNDV
ncbi:hypothetical protein [Bradyrhizobium sp. AZCC 2230]|uniref:hypothetical protein n=1 Tax=Bradyrhizobium sp. AZCC 2230 TaxID=3117021 RepID=UPI002FF2ABF4